MNNVRMIVAYIHCTEHFAYLIPSNPLKNSIQWILLNPYCTNEETTWVNEKLLHFEKLCIWGKMKVADRRGGKNRRRANTELGISNISFGLTPESCQPLPHWIPSEGKLTCVLVKKLPGFWEILNAVHTKCLATFCICVLRICCEHVFCQHQQYIST